MTLISGRDRGKTAAMRLSTLRVPACFLLVGLPTFNVCSQDELEPRPTQESVSPSDETPGEEGDSAEHGDEPFTLFPFFTNSRDPGDGSEYYQAFGLYHRWRDPGPGGNVDELTIAFPAYVEHNEDGQFLKTLLPFYWSWGNRSEFMSIGFPLYWREHTQLDETGPGDGYTVFAPFYFHVYSSTDTDRFFVPLYGYRSFPGEEQHSVLGPLYVYQRFEDVRGEKSGSAHSFAWPLMTFESREDDFTYRVLPLFSVSETGSDSNLLVTPFYYESSDTGGEFRYVFPFISSTTKPGETTNRYGMGLYTRERAHDADGTLLRSRDDALWGAVSFQRDVRAGMTHERMLPLAYWHTEKPDSSDTLYGPFYFSHTSIDSGDNRWSLDLLLGNLYVSSRVEGPPESAVTPASVTTGTPGGPTATKEVARTLVAPGPDRDGDRSLYPAHVERSVEKGILWPMIRWHRNELGHSSRWFAPFYFDDETDSSSSVAVFPLAYTQEDQGAYELSFFRYFFLWNSERWATGTRLSIGQLLFDWTSEDTRDRDEISILHPLFEGYRSSTGYGYHLLQIIAGNDNVEGGDHDTTLRLFPFFWYGYSDRQDTDGEWARQNEHFYLLPFYGFESTPTRVDNNAIYPLLHVAETTDSFQAEFWPLFFWQDRSTLQALRIWPFHSSEAGESADERWWVDWMFLSKYAFSPGRFSYRLDPFLYSYERDDDENTSRLDVLFGLYQKETAGEETRHTLFWFLSF